MNIWKYEENWRDIPDFPGYQVSTHGRARTFWVKNRRPRGYGTYCYLSNIPRIMPMSDDGNGYLKIFLHNHDTGKKRCCKIHKLVGEAFLSKPIDFDEVDYTIDHIRSGPDGKLDNSVWNLQWMSRGDNIRKAYREGRHDARIERSKHDVLAIDTWTGREWYFESLKDAEKWLRVDYTNISHALRKGNLVANRYYFTDVDGEDRLLYANEGYQCNQFVSWL